MCAFFVSLCLYVLSPNIGLAVLETTIGNNNQSLYTEYVTPESVLEFYRNVVANRLATNGSTCYQIFSAYNSGTCTWRCTSWLDCIG